MLCIIHGGFSVRNGEGLRTPLVVESVHTSSEPLLRSVSWDDIPRGPQMSNELWPRGQPPLASVVTGCISWRVSSGWGRLTASSRARGSLSHY